MSAVPDRVRVLTANLRGRRLDLAAFARVLDDVDPDVVAVQEASADTAALVTGRFDHHRIEVYSQQLRGGIAMRFPATFERLPFGDRSAWSATVEPADWGDPGRHLQLLAVHVSNPVQQPMWRSLSARRMQLGTIEEHLTSLARNDRPVVAVLGDFNASPAWPLYRRMSDRLTDAAVAAGTASRTWRPNGWGPPLLRIDHVFVDGLRATETRTVDLPGSDHLGVVADLVTFDAREAD